MSAPPELRTLIYRHKYRERAKNADKNGKVAEIDAFSDFKKDAYCQQSKGEGDDDSYERIRVVVDTPL